MDPAKEPPRAALPLSNVKREGIRRRRQRRRKAKAEVEAIRKEEERKKANVLEKSQAAIEAVQEAETRGDAPAKELPAWYRRLLALKKTDKEPDIYDEPVDIFDFPDDFFDQDISDPEEDKEEGSMREERKLELIDIKKQQQKHKNRLLNEEDTMVKKIQAAIEAVQTAESTRDAPAPFTPIAGTLFDLYCVDHVQHCFCDNYRSKYVEFWHHVPAGDWGRTPIEPPNSDTKMSGQIYLTPLEYVDFEKWLPPKEVGPKIYSIEGYGYPKHERRKFEFTFQFISNDYLMATVPREFVFMDAAVDPLAPETFTMYGIRYDFQFDRKRKLEDPSLDDLRHIYEWKKPKA